MPEALIEFFAVHTGAPFGYLLHFLLLLIFAVYSIIQLLKFLMPRFRKSAKPLIGGILAVYVALTLYADIELNGYEWNNHYATEADLVEEWKDGSSILNLNKSGTFQAVFNKNHSARIGFKEGKGTWYVNDSAIFLSLSPKRISLRVTKFRNLYRLIIDDFGDPDMWNGKLGFKRKS